MPYARYDETPESVLAQIATLPGAAASAARRCASSQSAMAWSLAWSMMVGRCFIRHVLAQVVGDGN